MHAHTHTHTGTHTVHYTYTHTHTVSVVCCLLSLILLSVIQRTVVGQRGQDVVGYVYKALLYPWRESINWGVVTTTDRAISLPLHPPAPFVQCLALRIPEPSLTGDPHPQRQTCWNGRRTMYPRYEVFLSSMQCTVFHCIQLKCGVVVW